MLEIRHSLTLGRGNQILKNLVLKIIDHSRQQAETHLVLFFLLATEFNCTYNSLGPSTNDAIESGVFV